MSVGFVKRLTTGVRTRKTVATRLRKRRGRKMGKILVDFDMTGAPYEVFSVTKETELMVYGNATHLPSGETEKFEAYKSQSGAKELTYDCACAAVRAMKGKLNRQVLASVCYFLENQDRLSFEKLFGRPAPISGSPAEVFARAGEIVETLMNRIENTSTWFTHKFLKWGSYDVEEQVGLLRSLYRANEIANSGNFLVKLPGFLQLLMNEAFYEENNA
jgi:hypothetical protein